MTLVAEPFPGVKILRPFVHRDRRGSFVKHFHEQQLRSLGAFVPVIEQFYSTSSVGVVRGMHFQTPPAAHNKLVHVIKGRVLDVILDIRVGSPTFGKSHSFELSESNAHVVFLPVGIAHGFASLADGTCVMYTVDHPHTPANDAGIFYDSFGFKWPFPRPILSDRDRSFPPFADFKSPFVFQ